MKTKIYKVLSIMLTLAVILSTCLCAMGTISAAEVTYYVSATGDDDANTGEENSAFITVKKAVEKAVAENYGAGDTVTVKVSSTTSAPVSWGGDMPTHAFKLVLKSASDTQACITTGSGTYINLGGDTDFENLVLSGSGGIRFGANVNFAENTKLSAWYNYVGTDKTTTENVQNVNINGTFTGYTFTFANGAGDNTYTAPLNITVNEFNCSRTEYAMFLFGGLKNTTTQYNSSVNFKLNKANIITFAKAMDSNFAFGENGAFQFLNLTGLACGIDDGELVNIDDSKKWILNVQTAVKNVINFTDSVGVYIIDSEYKATAVSADGTKTKESQNGILDLTELGAGEYTISIGKDGVVKDYYVLNGGTGDGSSPASPVATIFDAVNKINEDNLTGYDTANIHVMQKDDYATIAGGTHGMTIMGNNGTMPAHAAKIVIQSYGDTKVNLCSDSVVGNNTAATPFRFTGSVEFKNINLVLSAYNGAVYCGGYNVKFNSDVSVMYGKNENGTVGLYLADPVNGWFSICDFGAGSANLTYNETANIIINNKVTNRILFSAAVASRNQTFAKDVNVVIDNEHTATGITWARCTTKVNGNLNLIIKNANKLTNEAGTGTLAITGALQMIVNSNTEISGNPLEFTNVTAAKGKWLITNNTGNADIISCTETAGKYKVANIGDKKSVVAVDGNNNIIDVEAGYLVLNPGAYTISIKCIEHTYDNDCDADCNDCGATRTPADHVYDNDCDADCNECGATRTPADHVYDNDCDADCNECGATRTPADHVYDNDCDADCNECGATRTTAHTYDNDCDVDCNECGEIRTTAHIYDNDCDADCNECGATRTPADHVYDNDCDADCNECGATRTPADHVYDNDCDVDCNECGATRTPADHVYDNDCDADCNECGATRTPADHVYDNESDTDCNECGATRQLGAQIIEEGGVKYYYYDGVKSTATGIVEYNGKQIYINKGRFLGRTGIVTVEGKKVYVRNGYFLGATGIVTIDGKKLYIRKGYFLGATGIVTIDGKKLYIRNGYFLGATGIVTIDGKKLYIRNGYFLGASGTVKVNGKTYKVVKGIVK